METERQKPLSFAPFPRTGIWTAIGLSRGAFFLILLGAIGVYVFWGGPIWSHLGRDDFTRIAVSYGVIPVAVAIALARSHNLGLATFAAATTVIAVLKLVLTASLALVIGL